MAKNRTQYFVDGAVQGALLRRLLMHWAVMLGAVGAFLYFVELLGADPQRAAVNVLRRHGPSVVALLALVPVFVVDLFRLTNRFAGPMVRLRRAMQALGRGEQVKPIEFREGDFWQELAADFNRVIRRVETAPTATPAVESESNAETMAGACR